LAILWVSTSRGQPSAIAAGRALFAQSRLEKKSANDADRLAKYLGRFGLKFENPRVPSDRS
jgi:transcriptional regulatory protein RtcR